MKPIHDAHVKQPGLAVVEVAAADNATTLTVQELLAAHCAIAPGDRTVHEPSEPGVRLRTSRLAAQNWIPRPKMSAASARSWLTGWAPRSPHGSKPTIISSSAIVSSSP
ncbi:DUF6207 family protein [Streptomyces sviceus]|uniref:DUF6207 family protein n=1 Tax=Streptomyces sviceus TaxID=285530 RepID=UPI00382FCCB5